MDEHGKFGEHEKSVRVARGAAESNSSFLSNNSIQTQVVLEKNRLLQLCRVYQVIVLQPKTMNK